MAARSQLSFNRKAKLTANQREVMILITALQVSGLDEEQKKKLCAIEIKLWVEFGLVRKG